MTAPDVGRFTELDVERVVPAMQRVARRDAPWVVPTTCRATVVRTFRRAARRATPRRAGEP